jgi:hypothetical protein
MGGMKPEYQKAKGAARIIVLRPWGVILGRVTKNRSVFPKIAENRRNQTGPNLKIAEFTVSKFQKKIKINKIYVQTRSNSKVSGEEIFVKSGRLGW